MWSSGVQENKTPKLPALAHHTFILSPKVGLLLWLISNFILKNLTQCYISSCPWKLISPFINAFQKLFLADHLPALYDKTCCTNFSSPVLFIPSNICRTLSSHLAIPAWSTPISSAALLHTASHFPLPPLSFVLFLLSVSPSDLSFPLVLWVFQPSLVRQVQISSLPLWRVCLI